MNLSRRAAWPALAVLLLVLFSLARPGRAAVQFDVFAGYDGHVRESGWFPIACEIHNDGAAFNGVIELSVGGQFGGEPVRRIPIELPTNTRKRLVVPMFAAGGRFAGTWDAKLLDSSRSVRAERLAIQVKSLSWQGVLLGALPRTFGGLPTLPTIKANRPEIQPAVARFQLEQFPDNPLALEGLSALYLNSEKALELSAPQTAALLGWVRGGGHLILAVEQPTDVNATPWLQQFLPVEISGVRNREVDGDLEAWLRSDLAAVELEETLSGRAGNRQRNPESAGFYQTLERDAAFTGAQMPVVTGGVRDGQVLMGQAQAPLAVQASRGRGKLTVLMFSPEREPFKSWKQRSYFWARLAQVPPGWFATSDFSHWGAWSMDGVMGALIDSRQVKKLPVEWLLALLLVYLVVIGPFDQWWLKKINRQMLTWITFPCYVVFFSLLIYFIGYKLRAGETEWNEIQIVDVLPRGEKADLRGRTYISVYSSSNARYALAAEPSFSALRPEFTDLYSGGGDANRADVEQTGNAFKANVFVPVWTSLLFVNEWFKTADRPLVATVAQAGGEWAVKIENTTEQAFTDVRVVAGETVFEIGALAAGGRFEKTLNPAQGTPLAGFVQKNGGYFQNAVERRRNPLGNDNVGRLEDRPLTVTTASFNAMLDGEGDHRRHIISPAGLDMSAEARRGDAVVFAWVAGHAFAKPINQFQPIRLRRDSMLRLVVPVRKSSAL